MNSAVRCSVLNVALAAALLCVGAAPGVTAKPHRVTIRNLMYHPAKITIKVGESVQWINKDDHDHTVVAMNKSFSSENLGRDDTFRHVFTRAGKFEYYCRYHPRMKGTVTVEK